MDLNALELFVVSARSGSLSEAARRTGIPLPTLSRKVRRLEDDIGMRLLERGPTGLVLTQLGTRLLAEVEPALSMLTQAEHSIRDATRVAGTLRISIPPHFKPLWANLSRFLDRFPAVSFDVFVTDRRVDLVADGIDVALRIGEGGHVSYAGLLLLGGNAYKPVL
ncbi:LysR family transcriptional regulator [Sedimenticola sp.]|uniref:LysR family transcriptional regulator n=1 Tax=Sedimenticola sp. TaxID=1940285 RepID=UPI003D132300